MPGMQGQSGGRRLDGGGPAHYIGQTMGGTRDRSGEGHDEKAERLAQALRENLRRRKAQARARATEPRPADRGEAENDDDGRPRG